MSTVGEELKGTYLSELLDQRPTYKISDFWALVCCGDDLHHPYDGWSGYAVAPIFTDNPVYELYFGDFSDSLAEYENVPDFMINRDVSKEDAYNKMHSYVSGISDNPVFISANARTWASRILNQADEQSSTSPWDVSHVCVRDLYSRVTNEELFTRAGEGIQSSFALVRPLPKRFGLHAIADQLGIQVPCNSTKVMHRVTLLKQVTEQLLLRAYPLS